MDVRPFFAKYAAPCAVPGRNLTVAGELARGGPRVVFASPPGFVDFVDIASALDGEALWVWLDEFDDDPKVLLSSVAQGVLRRSSGGTSRPRLADARQVGGGAAGQRVGRSTSGAGEHG